jgi:hypothetical protein
MYTTLLAVGIATTCLVPAQASDASGHPGLAYVFFNQSDFQRPAEAGVQPVIRMETQGVNFGWLWLGKVRFPEAAEVIFSAEADDGLRLYLGDAIVIDGPDPGNAREGKISVSAGQILAIWLEYYQRGGDAHLRLYWQWDGHPRELLPASALLHDDSDVTLSQSISAGKATATRGGPPVAQAPIGDEADNASIYRPQARPVGDAVPLRLGPGPHLFLDEFLIDQHRGISRRVHRPERDPQIPNPLITGKEDECNGPYLTVIRDPATGRFRIWYNTNKVKFQDGSSHVAVLESDDGIHWQRPHRVLADPGGFNFGSSVLDEGPAFPDPRLRYKLAWWYGGGLRLAVSPDGWQWTAWKPYAVIRHNHDITNIFYDSSRRRYLATISVYTSGRNYAGERRCTLHTASPDLRTWEKPWYVLRPDDRVDPGQTQFYAMCGYLQRGDVLLGLVKVLHDDWRAAGTPEGAYGMGFTTLAWTRDGCHWVRDQEPFFEPDPNVEAWDHAHAWIDQQLPIGNEVYLYYGGYKFGHKFDRWEGRQIGLVKMQRDRYVSRDAGPDGGSLVTPPVVLAGSGMTVNARVRGELRVALLNVDRTPVPRFAADDCQPIEGDSLTHAVQWNRPLSDLGETAVRIEFRLRDAELYSFELDTGATSTGSQP